MINWKRAYKAIPARVQVRRQKYYEVLWTEGYVSDHNLGEMRPDTRQILISKLQPPKEAVHTYWHEVLHAISHEFDIGLTESQVSKLELALYYILKPCNLFKVKV